MSALVPRATIVRRPTEYEMLIEQHGTREQARFFLEHQDQSIDEVETRHVRVHRAIDSVARAIPRSWRTAILLRADLHRFVFEDHDIIIAVGQDGLVANVAKYLCGQYVIGVNPDHEAYEGILVRHQPAAVADVLADCGARRCTVELRTMAAASLDDGQRLLALNEIFIGHHSHQSARYCFNWDGADERQSSSGIIVSTGTGSTGWARSISRERNNPISLPRPEDRVLAYFVREPFPGSGFETKTTSGILREAQRLQVVSEMNTGGVIFGDGIEEDRIDFVWGAKTLIGIADERLALVV